MVPCYNEASRIRAEDFLTFARGSGGRARLLFVDDGSADDTLAILEDIRSKCPEGVSVLALPRNVGSGAVSEMLTGCDDGSSFVGFWDADLAPLDHVAMFRDVFVRPRWTWCSARASDSSVDAYDDPCDGITWVASSPPSSTA